MGAGLAAGLNRGGFDPAPDLLPDALAVNAFLAGGMDRFPDLVSAFGLAQDPEGGLLLGIALQAHAQGRWDLAADKFAEFCRPVPRLAVAGRVLEVLYKALNAEAPGLPSHWVRLVMAVYQAHPAQSEAQRLALEFFTYFGLWQHAASLLAPLPPGAFLPWRRHVQDWSGRAAAYRPARDFSFLILTWNRAELLDRCLAEVCAKTASPSREIIVGVNGSTDATREVLARHDIQQVLWNPRNDSVDYYRDLFEAGQGEVLIEIDDNVTELPASFDLELARYLRVFPEYGYIGYQPIRHDASTDAEAIMHGAPESAYRRVDRDGLTVHAGPTWGCCAAMRKEDWLEMGGFYGVRMSKTLGEEPQILRKLALRGRGGALVRGPRLVKTYP